MWLPAVVVGGGPGGLRYGGCSYEATRISVAERPVISQITAPSFADVAPVLTDSKYWGVLGGLVPPERTDGCSVCAEYGLCIWPGPSFRCGIPDPQVCIRFNIVVEASGLESWR